MGLYDYLPPELRNDFIRAGHNTYAGPGAKNAVDKIGAKKVGRALRGKGGTGDKSGYQSDDFAKALVRKERPVMVAKFDRRQAVKAAKKSGVAGSVKAAKQAGNKALFNAKNDPDSARSERRARKAYKKNPMTVSP